jgi:Tfp pilus assembly protein PilO|tara:strand:- start:11 stop:661 length:651 start_codon:yes stop_codon:yes gene_type:complete
VVKNFITELTKVTDFFIIVATVFVFLAFITPAEKSMQPLIDQNESELSSILNDRSQLISILESYRQQEASLKNELNTILNAPLEIIEVDEPIVSIEGDEPIVGIELENIDQAPPIDTSLIEADISQTERQINSSIIDLQQLENKISATEQTIKDLKLESKSSKSVGWLQPIRKNTMILINAGGVDGLIAGFASLIFCLVFKRRRGWFSNVFGIRLK